MSTDKVIETMLGVANKNWDTNYDKNLMHGIEGENKYNLKPMYLWLFLRGLINQWKVEDTEKQILNKVDD